MTGHLTNEEKIMAEVKIDIKASDEATPAFNSAERSASGLVDTLRELDSISLEKRISLDVGQALSGARSVRDAIDAIPDTSVKTVVVRYQTQASPIRPFSEGIEYIKKKMESLPTGGDYTMKFGRGTGSPIPSGPGIVDKGGLVPPFAPVVNLTVNGGGMPEGATLAREVDLALADLWRTNRSELRRAQSE